MAERDPWTRFIGGHGGPVSRLGDSATGETGLPFRRPVDQARGGTGGPGYCPWALMLISVVVMKAFLKH